MKQMQIKYLPLYLTLLLQLIGCNNNDSGGTSKPSKSVWSSWTSNDNLLTLNLSGGQFGLQQSFALMVVSTHAICTCNFIANGTESSGTYSFTSCTYSSGGSGDPGCSGLNESGTYTNNGTNLTACANSNCTTYH